MYGPFLDMSGVENIGTTKRDLMHVFTRFQFVLLKDKTAASVALFINPASATRQSQ